MFPELGDFSGGIFTCNWASFHLAWQEERRGEEGNQVGAITSPISWPRQRQPGCWRWCISDQRAKSCQQPWLAQQPDCSWIDLSLWSGKILTAGTVYAKKRRESWRGGRESKRESERERERERARERERERERESTSCENRGERERVCAGGYTELRVNTGRYLL